MISKKLVAASILAAMGTSAYALDPIKVGDWDLSVSGSVNAQYTNLNCKRAGNTGTGTALGVCGAATDSQSVQNGLLPGFIIFTASTKQNGYDISGTISIDPGTTSNGGGVGQSLGDQRRVFLTFGNANMGTVKMGRDIALFGQNAILNDMSLVASGGGAGFNGGLNTTLGQIGAGYVYTEFQPQITYTTPNLGGLSLSAGIFNPKAPFGTGTQDQDTVGFQGLAAYTFTGGKLWAALINQSDAYNNAGVTEDLQGYEIGGTFGIGGLQLTGNYFNGDGLGTGLIGLGGVDATGRSRDSDGYYVQATYKIGDTKFGVNYGESTLDANAADAGTEILDKNEQTVLGVYHSLTPSLMLTGEYIMSKQKYQGGTTAAGKADTIALGAILFF